MSQRTFTMRPMLSLAVIALAAATLTAQAPVVRWLPQSSGVTARLRGVSAVSPAVGWASGAAGTVLRTTDAGTTWQRLTVPGAEALDFRDIDATDARTAHVLSIGSGAASRIYQTSDAGATWTERFVNTDPQAFFDAMTFADADHGVAVSDSVDGRFVILLTTNGGRTWTPVPAASLPPALPGEGAFAASGTNVAMAGPRHLWFATTKSRVVRSTDGGRSWTVHQTPIATGEATGIFSVAFRGTRHGIVVGGNYSQERATGAHAAVTSDGGVTWSLAPAPGVGGFRSAVAWLPSVRAWLTVGPAGSDLASDAAGIWTPAGGDGYDAMSIHAASGTGWATGSGGRIARVAVGGSGGRIRQ